MKKASAVVLKHDPEAAATVVEASEKYANITELLKRPTPLGRACGLLALRRLTGASHQPAWHGYPVLVQAFSPRSGRPPSHQIHTFEHRMAPGPRELHRHKEEGEARIRNPETHPQRQQRGRQPAVAVDQGSPQSAQREPSKAGG